MYLILVCICLAIVLWIFHVANVYKRCSNLTGWILRTFNTRETISMMTLFKSLVLSPLDYASQLYGLPQLIKLNLFNIEGSTFIYKTLPASRISRMMSAKNY